MNPPVDYSPRHTNAFNQNSLLFSAKYFKYVGKDSFSRVAFHFISANFYSKINISSGFTTKISQAVGTCSNLRREKYFYDFTDICQKFQWFPCDSEYDNKVLKRQVRVRIAVFTYIIILYYYDFAL